MSDLAGIRRRLAQYKTTERELRAELDAVGAAIASLEKALLSREREQFTLGGMTSAEQGLARSRPLAKDALNRAANDRGMSLRALARKVHTSVSLLSMARRGQRSIKGSLAKAIERETGFAATPENWPGGIT